MKRGKDFISSNNNNKIIPNIKNKLEVQDLLIFMKKEYIQNKLHII